MEKTSKFAMLTRGWFSALALVMMCTAALASCSENDDDSLNEYANWTARNDSAFTAVLGQARAAVVEARALHGDNWQEFTPWRLFTNWQKPVGATIESSDTVVVYVENTGVGPGCPIYSDSVHVNYIGRLIPTTLHPKGYVFDHSGTSAEEDIIFDKSLCTPSLMQAGGSVAGFATAIQKMHVGDRWQLYIHPDLAYGEQTLTSIPAHSVLHFTVELKAYYRKGTIAGSWK